MVFFPIALGPFGIICCWAWLLNRIGIPIWLSRLAALIWRQAVHSLGKWKAVIWADPHPQHHHCCIKHNSWLCFFFFFYSPLPHLLSFKARNEITAFLLFSHHSVTLDCAVLWYSTDLCMKGSSSVCLPPPCSVVKVQGQATEQWGQGGVGEDSHVCSRTPQKDGCVVSHRAWTQTFWKKRRLLPNHRHLTSEFWDSLFWFHQHREIQ